MDFSRSAGRIEAMIKKSRNRHHGSTLDSFLKEEGPRRVPLSRRQGGHRLADSAGDEEEKAVQEQDGRAYGHEPGPA
jgi:hypothetical protein